ncbi:helix-turn-helix domain-containing protein [Ancylothrix sp. C2]|uniref:helix-turn-helix domain-containing protein n=1 Tax=Ancylothrix sp. D3o TaxID=2953691 RepID=UPI0021BB1BA0|nr:helix-turn-helix domain-containing protein [Ancylothrix sp. D3o]MCT7952887.1 helix-turn-helix domain-containing protein [Ancylothrix sp. D3o]
MFVDKRTAAEILSKSPRTLIRYRTQGILIEGIHCAFVGNEWLYNEELLQDLITCNMNPQHPDHQRAIAYYQSQKLGNKLKGRRQKYQAI